MAVPASKTFTGSRLAERFSIARDSQELVRREIGGRILRVDPDYAYGRQMLVRADDGSLSRVPFDLELVCLQDGTSAYWHELRAGLEVAA